MRFMSLFFLPKHGYFAAVAPLLRKGQIKTGYAAASLFVGLRGNAKELGLKAQNIWSFTEYVSFAGYMLKAVHSCIYRV